MTELQHATEPSVDVYEETLQEYLAAAEEDALLRGYEIGRNALAGGVGLLDIVTTHSRSVAAALENVVSDKEKHLLMKAQAEFLIETLSPFEMARRAFCDANAVLRRLNDVLEAQAKRIGYALHNEAGQLLASVHFTLAEASRDLSADKTKHLDEVRAMLTEIETRLRNLSHELRPPVLDDIGLSGALDLVAQGISSRWGLPVTVSVNLETPLPASIENTIYRITQEALTNAAKHASASRAEVRVQQTARKLVCSVRDDGTGFDDTDAFRKGRPGLGLTEIRERVGALGGIVRLGLHRKGGTDLTVEIPLDR